MDTIRIIHNLPRSGGSIISKSISAQKDIILLSEIHPEGPKIIKKRGAEAKFADPLYQFQNWYKLFSADELKKIEENNLNFLQKILTINNKVKDQNKILVIRDWSFIDYLGQPYIDPINKSTLFELLNKQFDVKNLFLIRDPLEMFLSCLKNLDFFPKNYSFDKFLDGYDYFIKDISLDNTITFEKFTSDPDKTLEKISSILNFKFDPNYLDNFKKIKITGDEEAFDAINIRIKQNTSYKSLTDEQRKQINKKLKYNTIMTKISEFYLNKK
jgi:hypothetical protein